MAERLVEMIEILRRIPIFSRMDPARLKLLVFASERLHWNAGEYVFHQGENADCAYLILQGSVDVVSETPEGEIVLATLEKQELLGEIAILCDIRRTASIRARENLSMLKIRKDHFLHMVTKYPEVAVPVMQELASRLEMTTRKLTEANNKLKQHEG